MTNDKKRWLILTEKPSVAGDIAKALGGFQKLGEYYESDDHVATWAVGHLLELLSPEEIDEKYKRWLLQDLPIIPEKFTHKPKQGQAERIKVIKTLMKRPDVVGVINACDAGREGELIFREIFEFCGRDLPMKRLWLQSMTPLAIRNEFKNLKDGRDFDALGDAARCRAESDWLIGMNGTRAMTRRLRPRSQKGVSWSVGRVQTPTLALLVERERKILKHRPESYFILDGRFSVATHEYSGAWFDPQFKKDASADDDGLSGEKDDRIFSRERLDAILADVKAHQASAQARETRKSSKEIAPQLFDLTMLQREANRRFGMSASRTLQAAQRLYEKHKMLTYPRTDSKFLPEDYRKTTRDVLAKLKDDSPEFGKFAARLLKDGLQNEKRVFDDTKISDHFAIIPTGEFDVSKLDGDDLRVFDLVLRRFLSAFLAPAQWAKVERITTVGAQNFRTRVQDLEVPGWREVYGKESEEESSLPPLVAGVPNGESSVQFVSVEEQSRQTTPPSRHSEARLLSLMETCGRQVENEDVAEALKEKGIGTPATRADIIENLIAKEYVARAGRGLRATAKGIRLLDVLGRVPVTGLASVELTGEMESELKRVEKGEGSRRAFMDRMVEYTRDIVEKAKSFDYEAIYAADEPLGSCPNHPNKSVRETFWAYKCEEPDCEFIIWKEKNQRYIDRSIVADVLSHRHFGPVEFLNSAGLPYESWLKIDGSTMVMCDESGETSEVPRGEQPVLHEEFLETSFLGKPGRFYETEAAYFFEFDVLPGDREKEEEAQVGAEKAVKTGKKTKKPAKKKKMVARMPRLLCHFPVTRETFLGFIQTGQTEPITEFKSKKGRPFAASLHLKDNGNFEFKFESRKKLLGLDEKPEKKATGKKVARGKAKVVKKRNEAAETVGEEPQPAS
jgi:DNA topoisomerase-3